MRTALVIVAIAALARPAVAQVATTLPSSIAGESRAIIERIADSARTAGLPVEPLYAKAAEGKLKDASDESIVVAVRGLAQRLGEARAGLGTGLDAGALTAAATALRSGVPMETLQRLARTARSAERDPRSLSANFGVAVVTLVDVTRKRVSVGAATTAIESLLAHRARDDQYSSLRLAVEGDVVDGQNPDQAIRARTEAIVRALPRVPREPFAPPQDSNR